MVKICTFCGVPADPAVKEVYYDIYHRISDGRAAWEPLVFTSDWCEENIHDEEDHEAMMLAMERDMANRGLCPKCGIPDLRGITADMILSDEDLREFQNMWAMEAAERRAGC